jgi:hypothetical protein
MNRSSANQDESLTIPAGHSVHACDLDTDQPWCEIRPDSGDMEPATKLRIPWALAYFLRTHFCGSNKMRDLIVDHARRDIANTIGDALGVDLSRLPRSSP